MITTQQMKALEDFAESQGISTLELMENAGREFVAAVKKKYDLNGKRIVIFCGTGNNAGDGFVAARYFAKEDSEASEASEASGNTPRDVLVLFFGIKEKLSEEAQRNYEKLKWPITLVQIKNKEDLDKFHFQKDLDMILIDALLGTGMKIKKSKEIKEKGTEAKCEIREPISFAIDLFNRLPGIKVAVDVPSGINADTGEVAEKHCKVDLIITFHDVKVGLMNLRQKTIVVDIGIPSENRRNGHVDIVIE